MPTFARYRAITRRPVRIGNTLVSRTASGTVVDLDNPAVRRSLRALGHLVENVTDQREGLSNFSLVDAMSNAAAIADGVQTYVAIDLPKGQTITSATLISATTALNTGTHQYVALYSSDGTTLTRVAVSADGTSGAWGANTSKTFTFATPYVTTYSGTYYVGILVTASAVPTLTGVTLQNAVVGALGFKRVGTAGSSLTATQASVALSGVTATATIPYVTVA